MGDMMTILICILGPSQSGKNTLMRRFMQDNPDVKRLVTATSRPRRPEEEDGVDKFFVAADVFENQPELFFEQVIEHGNHYGILKKELIKTVQENEVVIADLELRGIMSLVQAKEQLPCRLVPIYVCPDTFEELEDRIRKKGDANAEERIQTSKIEWHYRNDPVFVAVISTSCPIDESYAQLCAVIKRFKEVHHEP